MTDHLEGLIEDLSKRATDSDLLALLATSRQGRLYNAALARELRDVVEALRREMDLRQAALFRHSDENCVEFTNH